MTASATAGATSAVILIERPLLSRRHSWSYVIDEEFVLYANITEPDLVLARLQRGRDDTITHICLEQYLRLHCDWVNLCRAEHATKLPGVNALHQGVQLGHVTGDEQLPVQRPGYIVGERANIDRHAVAMRVAAGDAVKLLCRRRAYE